MSDYITASFDNLMGQASSTASVYLSNAKQHIDDVFGKGYAEKNPNLVAAFIETAASDYNTSSTAKVFASALKELAEGLRDIANAISEKK